MREKKSKRKRQNEKKGKCRTAGKSEEIIKID